MQNDDFTSLLLKIGMILLTTFENNNDISFQKNISNVLSEPAGSKRNPLVEQLHYGS